MIVHFFRQYTSPDYTGLNYGWDAVWENGRTTWLFSLREARQFVKGNKLRRGLHPDIDKQPFLFQNFNDYKRFGWSIYWGETE